MAENNAPSLTQQIKDVLGLEPITIAEANRRLADSDGLGIGYDDIEILAAEFPKIVSVDFDADVVTVANKKKEETKKEESKEERPAEPGAPITKEEADRAREWMLKRINPVTVVDGYAFLTDKAIEQWAVQSGCAPKLAGWGFATVRDFIAFLMADLDYCIVTKSTPSGDAERIRLKVGAKQSAQNAQSVQSAQSTPSAPKAPAAAKPTVISRYNFTQFAYFADGFKGFATRVAERAAGDDWFVIDEPGDNPMRLVMGKLGINFALAVRDALAHKPSALAICFDRATFDTGFVTAEGKRIIAHFTTNTERDNNRFQSWQFSELTEE